MLAFAVVAWGVYLVGVGTHVTVVAEGSNSGATIEVLDPRGWIPIFSGATIATGAALRALWMCWCGVVATTIFAVLLAFSAGFVLIPVVVALVVTLLLSQEAGDAAKS
jgi:hypothetical protein